MDVKILHFYPELMSLYGSYANVSVVRRALERLGHSVRVEYVAPGGQADLSDADFLFVGAGTERAQKAALADILRFAPALRDAEARGVTMLFAGNSMELLGRSITDRDGTVYPALELADFVSVQGGERFTGDVYGHTALFDAPVVGFMNKCSRITGVSSPLLHTLDMGFGNDGPCAPEGFCGRGVFASELTGPIMVKNPQLLRTVIASIHASRGLETPELEEDRFMVQSYRVTEEQLRARCARRG